MARESSHDCLRRVNLDGTNVGATMFVRRNASGESSPDCCCLNIYINNNVQGVNNSILVGSEVKLRDPGVRIYFFGDVVLNRRRPGSNNKSCKPDCLPPNLQTPASLHADRQHARYSTTYVIASCATQQASCLLILSDLISV
ncbi:hypothetical protein WN944_016620 [Citrus x changshan-huyou]|uniref:Uncharacterized protein n=2 Tax=Citrus TaxID=2706 RepID=A0AAP0MCB2_9ROSI